MLKNFKSFFENKLQPSEIEDAKADALKTNLASAALMIEVMKSDHELDAREAEKFVEVLQSQLLIDDDGIEELIELAETEAKQATSLYEFTRLINDHYDYEQKVALIENMWKIAFADDKLDKYEDHLIRKISELIYVTHSDFIKSKISARDNN